MKNKLTGILSLVLPAVIPWGCSGDESNPKTVTKDELNPPGDIRTVTRDSSIELRWSAANVEEDFRGYYVFGIKKSDYEAKAKGKGVYPKGKANPETAGIPRCKDNSAFFEAFGLPKSEADCEGAEETSSSSPSTTGAKLTADTTKKDETEKLTGFLACGGTKTTPSVSAKAPIVKEQKCVVNTLADGTTKLENGTEYAFFVVAVAGDDFNTVSWTSKVVFDAPSSDAIKEAAQKSLTFSAITEEHKSTMYKITLNPSAGTAAVGAAETCNGNTANTPCSAISQPNKQPTDDPVIYLSRAGINNYLQRLYISAPAGGKVRIQPRGPQTYDPYLGANTTDGRIPGDRPATVYPQTDGKEEESGTKYVVYNNQIFDLEITSGGKKYYGKVFIGDVTYTGDAGTNNAGFVAKVAINIVLQPGAGIAQYGLGSPDRAQISFE